MDEAHEGGQCGGTTPGMFAAEMAANDGVAPNTTGASNLRALARLVPLAGRLASPRPMWIVARATGAKEWAIEYHVQDRPKRITYVVIPSGKLTGISDHTGQSIVEGCGGDDRDP